VCMKYLSSWVRAIYSRNAFAIVTTPPGHNP
jgi:hypothetical protein